MTETPIHWAIADDLKTRIEDGRLAPDERLPSTAELARQYDASVNPVKRALASLKASGHIYGHAGKATYVRSARRLTRLSRGRYQRSSGPAPPFASDAHAAGQRPDWEHTTTREPAPSDIAARLGIETGAPVMRTSYRFFADGDPKQLSISYEPLAVTEGTPVEEPETGPLRGVITRMDSIGVYVTHVDETIATRAPWPHETSQLVIPEGAPVLVIERTHHTHTRPVETCDIVIPGDRYAVTYTTPVDTEAADSQDQPMPQQASAPEPQPVVAAVVTSDRGVLLGRRRDGNPPWTLIAGEIEPGESPTDAAVREVKEETGLQVAADDREIGRRVHPTTGRTMIYLACRPTGRTDVHVGDPDELAEVAWTGLAEMDEKLPGLFPPVRTHLAQHIG